MAFVADLLRLIENGKLDINDPPKQRGSSVDVSIGEMLRLNRHKLEHGKDGWLEETGRMLFGEAEYIAFTKEKIAVSPGYSLFVDPRSSFARLGLQAKKFEEDELSKFIEARKLPEYRGRIPLVLRTTRTNLFVPDNYPAVQLLVAEEGTRPLDTAQLMDVRRNGGVEVLSNGESVLPENGGFPLTLHPLIKRCQFSTRVLSPGGDSELYFETRNMSNFPGGFPLLESCFYLDIKLYTRMYHRLGGLCTQEKLLKNQWNLQAMFI